MRAGPDGALDVPPPPAPASNKAPKKGLQVTLPDDDADAAAAAAAKAKAKPKPVAAAPAPAAGKKGRRGNWWDSKSAHDDEEPPAEEPPAEEPPADEGEHDGATAFVKVEDLEPPKPKKPKPLPPSDEGEHDGATAFVNAKDLGVSDEGPEVEAPKPPPKPKKPRPAPPPPEPVVDETPVQRPLIVRVLARLVVISVVLGFFGMIALVGLYFYLSQSLPRLESADDYNPRVSTHVVAADGTEIGSFFQERRTVVPMSQIPQVLKDAVVSAEDKDFYKHHGISVIGLARAAVIDILSGKKRQGASTITQQVVKTFFLSNEKRFSRKVKEIVLAFKLEKDLSKDDILYLYLNQINFGRAHYGVEEAARYYFNKHVADLDLGEAAILAGLPQNPGRLNPRFHPTNATKRRNYVLDRMLANKKISQEQHDRELERPIALPPPPDEKFAQWYLDEVKRRLIDQFGEAAVNSAGMTVEVGMVPALQRDAERAVREGLRVLDQRQGWRGAEFTLGELQEPTLAALERRYRAMAPTPGAVMVFDLGGLNDQDQSLPDRIARAAHVRVLEPGGIYAGVVTKVQHNGIDVQLAPDIIGWVPFETMKWARKFKPEGGTPAPAAPSEVVKKGDVVEVMATKVKYTRSSVVRMRGTELELSLDQTPLVQGALAAIDLKTRNVVALVGGYDFALSQFDRATQAKRQPGSAFKPILYAAAIDSARYTAVTRVLDTPTPITDPWTGKSWDPKNFEKDEFDGPISLRKALATSKNTVAVKLLLDIGLDKVRSFAKAAGLSTEVPKSYTAALGTGEVVPLELTNAYATIASLGKRADPILIRKVKSRTNSIMQQAEVTTENAMKPEVAYVTSDLMRAVIDDPDGTARSLGILMRPIAGKTGTASEHRDGWFVGFTPSLVAGVWVGFDDHRVLGPLETGGHCAGPIWLRFMKAALAGTPIEDWPPPPPGVTVTKVNRNTGALATGSDPFAVREVFMAGTEPSASASGAGSTDSQEQLLKQQ